MLELTVNYPSAKFIGKGQLDVDVVGFAMFHNGKGSPFKLYASMENTVLEIVDKNRLVLSGIERIESEDVTYRKQQWSLVWIDET